MNIKVLILPGDGIGAEVTREAVRVLETVATKFDHQLSLTEGLLGGIAIHKTGTPLPDETVEARAGCGRDADGRRRVCRNSITPRPTSARSAVCSAFGRCSACSRTCSPVRTYAALIDSSPLKNHLVEGTDMIIVRELTGGIYYGTPRGISNEAGVERAVNTMTYTRPEIERVARMAFQLARNRRKKVTSVDKSNVLENSQLWRKVVTEVAAGYPDVELDHLLVDNCAMQLVLNPRRFDVLLNREHVRRHSE